MNNVLFCIVVTFVGLFFGLVAGIYANKSNQESWGEPAPASSWAFHLMLGGGLALLYALGKTLGFAVVNLWIFIAIFIVLALFQALNREGKYRMGAWDAIALLSCGLLIFTLAARLDEIKATSPSPALILLLIPAVLPFIVGAVRVYRLENGLVGEKSKATTDISFNTALIAITAIAVAIICIVGLSHWAFS